MHPFFEYETVSHYSKFIREILVAMNGRENTTVVSCCLLSRRRSGGMRSFPFSTAS